MPQRTGVKQPLPGVVYLSIQLHGIDVFYPPKTQSPPRWGKGRSAPYPGKENGPKSQILLQKGKLHIPGVLIKDLTMCHSQMPCSSTLTLLLVHSGEFLNLKQ